MADCHGKRRAGAGCKIPAKDDAASAAFAESIGCPAHAGRPRGLPGPDEGQSGIIPRRSRAAEESAHCRARNDDGRGPVRGGAGRERGQGSGCPGRWRGCCRGWIAGVYVRPESIVWRLGVGQGASCHYRRRVGAGFGGNRVDRKTSGGCICVAAGTGADNHCDCRWSWSANHCSWRKSVGSSQNGI